MLYYSRCASIISSYEAAICNEAPLGAHHKNHANRGTSATVGKYTWTGRCAIKVEGSGVLKRVNKGYRICLTVI